MGSLYFSSAARTALIAAVLSPARPCCATCAPSGPRATGESATKAVAATTARSERETVGWRCIDNSCWLDRRAFDQTPTVSRLCSGLPRQYLLMHRSFIHIPFAAFFLALSA